MKTIILIITLSLALAGPCFASPRISEYKAASMDQDTHGGKDGQETDMGVHDFCALSFVGSGGLNSACAVYKRGSSWVLIARDPGFPDPWTGEGQICMAQCIDFGAGGNDITDLDRGGDDIIKTFNLNGAWTAHDKGKITKGFKIVQKEKTLLFYPPDGNNVSGHFIENNKVLVSGWGSPTGTIGSDGKKITWSNGSNWTKD